MEAIQALIIAIALEIGVPPELALSIALTENNTLNPLAISQVNKDGSVDRGIMQLSDRYFGHVDWKCPESNIRAGIQHIKFLIEHPATSTYFSVIISYNAGLRWLIKGYDPPDSSVNYAVEVMRRWNEFTNGNAGTIITRKR